MKKVAIITRIPFSFNAQLRPRVVFYIIISLEAMLETERHVEFIAHFHNFYLNAYIEK